MRTPTTAVLVFGGFERTDAIVNERGMCMLASSLARDGRVNNAAESHFQHDGMSRCSKCISSGVQSHLHFPTQPDRRPTMISVHSTQGPHQTPRLLAGKYIYGPTYYVRIRNLCTLQSTLLLLLLLHTTPTSCVLFKTHR